MRGAIFDTVNRTEWIADRLIETASNVYDRNSNTVTVSEYVKHTE